MKDEVMDKNEIQESPKPKCTRVFQGGDGLTHDEGDYDENELT